MQQSLPTHADAGALYYSYGYILYQYGLTENLIRFTPSAFLQSV